MNNEIFFDCKLFILINLVLSRIKQKLLEAGTNTIATLPKIYRSVDSYDGKSKVGINEFFFGLTNYGINLRKEEANVIYNQVILVNHKLL